jgi:tetratricopeptide (TPR) repeat protein
MKKMFFICCLISSFVGLAQTKKETPEEKKARQQAIIQKYVDEGADQINYRYFMKEYQDVLDAGLKIDSTIAYIYRHKALAYYMVRKYSVGKIYLDKAVQHDEARWLPYRGFMKCIFAKDYHGAIEDLELSIQKYGNTYEMDHTYAFYLALSYLMINEFEKASEIFKKDIENQVAERTEAHFLDWFYYGMSLYEQQKWEEAIQCFDNSLDVHDTFAEALLYKTLSKLRLGHPEKECQDMYSKALENGKKGNTINETNASFEKYPYQINWK